MPRCVTALSLTLSNLPQTLQLAGNTGRSRTAKGGHPMSPLVEAGLVVLLVASLRHLIIQISK